MSTREENHFQLFLNEADKNNESNVPDNYMVESEHDALFSNN